MHKKILRIVSLLLAASLTAEPAAAGAPALGRFGASGQSRFSDAVFKEQTLVQKLTHFPAFSRAVTSGQYKAEAGLARSSADRSSAGFMRRFVLVISGGIGMLAASVVPALAAGSGQAVPAPAVTHEVYSFWTLLAQHPVISEVVALSVLMPFIIDLRKAHVRAKLTAQVFGINESNFRLFWWSLIIYRGVYLPLGLICFRSLVVLSGGSFEWLTLLLLVPLNEAFIIANAFPPYVRRVKNIREPYRLNAYADPDQFEKLEASLREIPTVGKITGVDFRQPEVKAVGLQWVVDAKWWEIWSWWKIRQSFMLWYQEPYLLRWIGLLAPYSNFIVPLEGWTPLKDSVRGWIKGKLTALRKVLKPAPAPIPQEDLVPVPVGNQNTFGSAQIPGNFPAVSPGAVHDSYAPSSVAQYILSSAA
jgi:hypothetical protein